MSYLFILIGKILKNSVDFFKLTLHYKTIDKHTLYYVIRMKLLSCELWKFRESGYIVPFKPIPRKYKTNGNEQVLLVYSFFWRLK